MVWFDIFLGTMLAYLCVYVIACYHIYIKPKNESAGNNSRPIHYYTTYCSPTFLLPPVKTSRL